MESTVPSRCQKEGCKKKLTLTSVSCKCKKFYCMSHRYETEHGCTFDYRNEQTKLLNKYMSTPIVSQKLEAI